LNIAHILIGIWDLSRGLGIKIPRQLFDGDEKTSLLSGLES